MVLKEKFNNFDNKMVLKLLIYALKLYFDSYTV